MHTLIVGVTQSGKTTLAHKIARDLAAQGQNIIVYDPVGTLTAAGTWPDSAVKFDDLDDFMEYMSLDAVVHAHVFIDEAGDLFGIGQKENFWLLTRGRHFGLIIYLIAQRPKMLAPSARTQCGRLYLFRVALEDAEEVGRDFGFSGLKNEMLDTGDFLIIDSGHTSKKRANVFALI